MISKPKMMPQNINHTEKRNISKIEFLMKIAKKKK
jgi:hypothetical protein